MAGTDHKGRAWREIESAVQQRDHDSREVRRSGQITNTNMCWWAVLSHVDLLFRDAHAGRVTWSTNTTSLAVWNLQHFFYYFSDCLDKTGQYLWNVTVHVLISRLLDGVECFFDFSDKTPSIRFYFTCLGIEGVFRANGRLVNISEFFVQTMHKLPPSFQT